MSITCTKCGSFLPQETLNAPELTVCPCCSSSVLVRVFPAMLRETHSSSGTGFAVAEGDASCFQHGSKRAVDSCSQCGRFLCSLCVVEMNDAVLCPACLLSGSSKGRLQHLETRRTLWDSIALTLAGLSLPVYILWIVSAPTTLFLAIRHWKAPSSLIPRNKWRFIVAILLAAAQLVLLGLLVFGIAMAFRQRPLGGMSNG